MPKASHNCPPGAYQDSLVRGSHNTIRVQSVNLGRGGKFDPNTYTLEYCDGLLLQDHSACKRIMDFAEGKETRSIYVCRADRKVKRNGNGHRIEV